MRRIIQAAAAGSVSERGVRGASHPDKKLENSLDESGYTNANFNEDLPQRPNQNFGQLVPAGGTSIHGQIAFLKMPLMHLQESPITLEANFKTGPRIPSK